MYSGVILSDSEGSRGTVIDRNVIRFAIERELPFGNAIGITADGTAKVVCTLFVLCRSAVAQNYVGQFSGLIWGLERD
jgi:hypothetical protein